MKLSLADVYALIDAVDLRLTSERAGRRRFPGNSTSAGLECEERIERLERLRQRLDTEIQHLLLPRSKQESDAPLRRYFGLVDDER